MSYICLVQESKRELREVLGFLLSSETFLKEDDKCIIYCDEAVRKLVEDFPKEFKFSIEFSIIDMESDSIFNCIQRKLAAVKSTIEKYGECLFVNKNFFMVNEFSITESLKEQKIGFIKKEFKCAEGKEYLKYSIDLLYINDLDMLGLITNYFEKELKISDMTNYNVTDLDSEAMKVIDSNIIKSYTKLPFFLATECKLEHFIDKNRSIGTEDFFAYEDSIKLGDISEELHINGNPISFINIHFNTMEPKVQELNRYLLNKMIARSMLYLNIFNVKMSKTKLAMRIPDKNGISIWDRNNECDGLYELFEMIAEESDYFTIQTSTLSYFSCGNYLIMDKPSSLWLNNDVKKYSGVLLCNYDESLLKEVSKSGIKNKFLSYYTSFPKKYESFVNNNEICKSIETVRVNVDGSDLETDASCLVLNKEFELPEAANDDVVVDDEAAPVVTDDVVVEDVVVEDVVVEDDKYTKYLQELSKFKYAKVECHDVNVLAELLGLGVIPIISHNTKIFDLVENVHYLRADSNTTLSSVEEENMKQSCIDYYNANMKSEAVMKKLIDHIFVWDF